MANGWTAERRAKQRELIRQWEPWKHSTGPKTLLGKQKVSQNASKGAMQMQLRQLQYLLQKQYKLLQRTTP